MDNETKLSNEQINSIMKEAQRLSYDEKINSEAFFKEHLNESQAEKVRSILNDPQKLKDIMESPLAKRILEALNKSKERE